jgi:hypothetical protein
MTNDDGAGDSGPGEVAGHNGGSENGGSENGVPAYNNGSPGKTQLSVSGLNEVEVQVAGQENHFRVPGDSRGDSRGDNGGNNSRGNNSRGDTRTLSRTVISPTALELELGSASGVDAHDGSHGAAVGGGGPVSASPVPGTEERYRVNETGSNPNNAHNAIGDSGSHGRSESRNHSDLSQSSRITPPHARDDSRKYTKRGQTQMAGKEKNKNIQEA